MSAVVDVETLPCGHPTGSSVFENADGNHVLLTLPPRAGAWGTIPGSVWCVDGCGWVKVTDEQHEAFKAVTV